MDVEITGRAARDVMGWKESWRAEYQPGADIPPYSEWRNCVSTLFYIGEFTCRRYSSWTPDKDISDAWLLVGKMFANGWTMSIYGNEAEGVTVGFRPSKWGAGAEREGHCNEASIPRAICVAAVEAVEAVTV